MGTKVTVDTITNVENSSGVPTLNDNFERVSDEFDNVLYRDGSLSISGNIDFDSNRILNLPDGVTNAEPATVGQTTALVLSAVSNLLINGRFFADTVDGLAGTEDQELFTVISGAEIVVYLNDAGAAVEEARFPTMALLNAVDGGTEIGYRQGGTGSVTRNLQAHARERVSVLDFGADPTGVADSTAEIEAAVLAIYDSNGPKRLHFPQGSYKVSNLGILDASGLIITGDSRWTTRLVAAAGTTGAIIGHSNPSGGSSGLHHISDLFIDLNGEDCTGIDLSSINNSVVERVRIEGGPNLAGAIGTGIRCAAPLDSASYTNKISDCDGTYLARAFVAEDAANENTFDNCEAIACAIGFDVENGVDAIRIIGGRAEGCTTGLRYGGNQMVVLGCRFEANTAADVSFLAGAARPTFIGCYTASSPTTFLNSSNCTGLYSKGGTFPQPDIEPNTSNPTLRSGRTTFAPAGTAPLNSTASTDYALFVQGYQLIQQNGAIEFENYNGGSDPDNRVVFANIDDSDRISIPGFNRKTGGYTRIYVGPNWNFNPSVGLEYSGIKVIGEQQAAVADATDASSAITQLNALLAALRTHGLIAT